KKSFLILSLGGAYSSDFLWNSTPYFCHSKKQLFGLMSHAKIRNQQSSSSFLSIKLGLSIF
ncbi:TPA: hypothetical protein ACQNO2_000397, partial [Streptococcus pyogenes]